MKFKALRPVRGDFGPDGLPRDIQEGEVFDVPDCMVRHLGLHKLEANAVVMRHFERRPIDRKAYMVYENKAVAPPQNKAVETPASAAAEPVASSQKLRNKR